MKRYEKMNAKRALKRVVFYWAVSFVFAAVVYWLLYLIMPHHWVFGALYRMFLYHWEHPMQYITIMCFFYGIIAALLADKFARAKTLTRVALTMLIIILTVAISSPFGGMLWHIHDMQAGWFPSNWLNIVLVKGFEWGLEVGWLVIALSIPYNIIGSIACFFITKWGAEKVL